MRTTRSAARIFAPSCSPSFPRHGMSLTYILLYMGIAAGLMTASGLCLHAILKADAADRREALFLSSMLRAERQLRADSGVAGVRFESPQSISIDAADGSTIRWNVNRGTLTRSVQQMDQNMASDRFVFPAGSQILIEQSAEKSISIRITEPSAFLKYSQSSDGGSNLNKPADEALPQTPKHVAQPKFAEIQLRGIQP